MTHENRNAVILAAIKSKTKSATNSKKSARAFLVKEGIYTAKGYLAVEFGGSAQNKKTA